MKKRYTPPICSTLNLYTENCLLLTISTNDDQTQSDDTIRSNERNSGIWSNGNDIWDNPED